MLRILYATDGSLGAIAAGEFLSGLPHSHDVHVHIVTVLEANEEEDSGGDGSQADTILTGARAALGEFPGHTTTAILWGASTSEVVQAIMNSAVLLWADLIVVGSQGRSDVSRFFLGSVSEALARYASCPVLVVRRPVGPLRRILIGVDGSGEAQAAATMAASVLPLPIACTLRLVQVVPDPPFLLAMPDAVVDGSYTMAVREVLEPQIAKARSGVESLAETIRQKTASKLDAPIVETRVTRGNPAMQLLRTADDFAANLIVVGSRGLTGMGRFLLGSVSERVLRHASCSVLVVRRGATDTR